MKGGLNANCHLVFFADGDVSPNNNESNSEEVYACKAKAEYFKEQGVSIYAVGLGQSTGQLLGLLADDANHCYQAGNMNEIVEAFRTIGSTIGSGVSGTFEDSISKDFVITDREGNPVDSFDGATIVTDSTTGCQKIIWSDLKISTNTEFTKSLYVVAKDEFAGGNVVNTNAGSSFVVTLDSDVDIISGGVSTMSDDSAKVNVKGEVDALPQESEIKRGEKLSKYLTEDFLKGFTTAVGSDYTDIELTFYEDEDYEKEIELEDLKEESPDEDIVYYVKVKAVPKTSGDDAKSSVGDGMTIDDTYYSLDRTDAEGEEEAVAFTTYTVTVKGYELILETDKKAAEKSWTDRTYTVTLEAATSNKVTKTTTTPGELKEPVKVLFILDVSSSMRIRQNGSDVVSRINEWPLIKLENQVKNFINKLPVESEVAAITFDKNAAFEIGSQYGFETIDSEAERTSLANDLTLKRDGNGTRSNEAFKKAVALMSDSSYENAYVIFFTDGETYVSSHFDDEYAVDRFGNSLSLDDGSYDQDKSRENHDNQAIANAATLKNKGVKIYSVGMKNGSWTTAAQNLLENVATANNSTYVMTGDDSDSIADQLKNIYDDVTIDSETKTVPAGAEGIKMYDEISEYFIITDANGNPLGDGAEFDGGVIGTNNGKQTITWEKLSTTAEDNKITKTIYLKAKDTFAGGNDVPTNGKFEVTVPDPNDNSKEIKSEKTSPTVDVNCVVRSGSDEETIFLGENLGAYWTDLRKTQIENKLIDSTPYTDFSFLDKTDVAWYYDEACTQPVEDMTAEAPKKETVYYGKISLAPISTGKLTEEMTTVVGKYTVKVILGEITVTKNISNLEDAKKLSYDGQPIFTFVLKKDGVAVQTKVIHFVDYSTDTRSVTFTKLGKGNYTVEELDAAGWEADGAKVSSGIPINKDSQTGSCSFTNKAVKQKAFADKAVAVNSVTANEDGTISFNRNNTSN